jgi:hypothetical protein
MDACRKSVGRSRVVEDMAKTEGKIEGDGTFVRRGVGLHEGWGGTARIGCVPWMAANLREHRWLCVLSALTCACVRRSPLHV